ncbi:MAG: protein-L-isoaspartate(D-aspartate) O-methyltransferase [Bryobacteraceae bacterium]
MSWRRLSPVALTVCATVISEFAGTADPLLRLRERMVSEQIENRGIRSPGVLRAMRAIPRHLFVPAELRLMAYEDFPLPIGRGATISQPYIVALMTELLAPTKNDRILEVGTGSGYQAAVLGQLAAEVYTIEIVPELAQSAARTLRELGYRRITVREGDGYQGWPDRAPFHGIMVTAAAEVIPEPLIDQLARGGRLVAPVGPSGNQNLVLLEKTKDGSVKQRIVAPVRFVPLRVK